MKIVWSKTADKPFSKIDTRYKSRIFKVRVGDYRIVYTLRDEPDNHCYVLAVKRRTSTTYLHEEKATYGCSAN